LVGATKDQKNRPYY